MVAAALLNKNDPGGLLDLRGLRNQYHPNAVSTMHPILITCIPACHQPPADSAPTKLLTRKSYYKSVQGACPVLELYMQPRYTELKNSSPWTGWWWKTGPGSIEKQVSRVSSFTWPRPSSKRPFKPGLGWPTIAIANRLVWHQYTSPRDTKECGAVFGHLDAPRGLDAATVKHQ